MAGEKRCRNLVVFYRSPIQDQDEFDSFFDNFELTPDKLARNNPFLLAVIGDLTQNQRFGIP